MEIRCADFTLRKKGLYEVENENSFEERSVEELLEYLECKWLNIENQQVMFISTILQSGDSRIYARFC